LFGHEGATTTANFSPMGDFIISGGQDSNVNIWESNLAAQKTEELAGLTVNKTKTDVYVTDKENIKRIP